MAGRNANAQTYVSEFIFIKQMLFCTDTLSKVHIASNSWVGLARSHAAADACYLYRATLFYNFPICLHPLKMTCRFLNKQQDAEQENHQVEWERNGYNKPILPN